ncbi:MAG: hypothetical protein NT062_17815 [Proteobacteria bacterium]|nr:hypothetical protein [Pseudomonadota bacterium]
MKLVACALALSSSLLACGNAPTTGNTTDPDAAVDPNVDGAVPPGWTKLIARSWTLGAAVHDDYQCRRIMVTDEMWISGFQALSPLGTHHQVLTISAGGTTGDYHCSAGDLDQKMLYASGVGTDEMVFPTGYAVHLLPGQYININLHLFNAGDTDLAGESGVLVQTVPAATNPKEIGFMFGGTTVIAIKPDSLDHTVSGTCTTKDWDLFALWPHMHQTAVYQKVEWTHGATTVPLHDAPYAFSDQKFYPMTQTHLSAGDTLRVSCTYNNNPTSNPAGGYVTFGDGSQKEMCFTGFYTYPAPTQIFECTQGI